MIIRMPKNTKVVSEHHTCDYHKTHPGDVDYPGCTCSYSWGLEVVRE